MNELEVVEKIQGNENVPVIDSREVAEMVGMRHTDLLRNIDHYIEAMGQNPKLGFDNFFIPQTYTAGTGKNSKLSSSNFFIGLKFFGVRTGGTQVRTLLLDLRSLLRHGRALNGGIAPVTSCVAL